MFSRRISSTADDLNNSAGPGICSPESALVGTGAMLILFSLSHAFRAAEDRRRREGIDVLLSLRLDLARENLHLLFQGAVDHLEDLGLLAVADAGFHLHRHGHAVVVQGPEHAGSAALAALALA